MIGVRSTLFNTRLPSTLVPAVNLARSRVLAPSVVPRAPTMAISRSFASGGFGGLGGNFGGLGGGQGGQSNGGNNRT